jgi:haloalkane dehalogenase
MTSGAESAGRLWDEPPRFQAVPTARIAHWTIGQGPPLVLVHGWPLSSFSFRRLVPWLQEHFTCHLPDLPGLGETEWTAATDFRFRGQAATLRAFADGLGLDDYAVLAFDTGASIARELALVAPTRVRKLVLLNTEIPGHRPPWIRLFQQLVRLPGSDAGFRMLLGMRAFLRSGMGFGGCFVDLDLIDGEFRRHVVEPLVRDPRRLDGMKRYLRGIDWALVDGFATRHRDLRQPTLFVWGEDDPTFPVALGREMSRQLPACAGFVAVSGARLLVHEERPAEVGRAALAFLRGTP